MSLNYLLDGYNLIMQQPHLAQKSLEDARQALVSWLEINRPQGSFNNAVTVVFDGKPGMVGGTRSASVRVIFAQGESADERIKKMVAQSAHPKAIVVVTDDKDIRLFVRKQGAIILGVKEFFFRGAKSRATDGRHTAAESARSAPEEKYISKTLEFKITSEFEQLWLKKASQRPRKP